MNRDTNLMNITQFIGPRWVNVLTWMVGLAFLIGLGHIVTLAIIAQDPIAGTDFSVFWVSARLVSLGQSPYDPQAWSSIYEQIPFVSMQDATFLYPLPTAFLFLPLSFFSEPIALHIWMVASQLMIIGATVIYAKALNWTQAKLYLPFIVLSLFIFVPAMVVIMNGQISGFLLLNITLALFLWSRGHWFWGGAIIALLIVKPAGAGVFLFMVSVWLLLRREWSGLLGITMTVTLCIGATWIFQPMWVFDWLDVGFGKVVQLWTSVPTIWGVAAILLGPSHYWPFVAGAISVLLLLLGIAWTMRFQTDEQIVLLGGVLLPLSLIITPYLIIYEQVMLVPALITIIALLDKAGVSFRLVLILPFLISFVGIFLKVLSLRYDRIVWVFFPIFIMFVFFITWRYTRQPSFFPLSK